MFHFRIVAMFITQLLTSSRRRSVPPPSFFFFFQKLGRTTPGAVRSCCCSSLNNISQKFTQFQQVTSKLMPSQPKKSELLAPYGASISNLGSVDVFFNFCASYNACRSDSISF
jgi:hypothetical protein